jgi:hypothetical protein
MWTHSSNLKQFSFQNNKYHLLFYNLITKQLIEILSTSVNNRIRFYTFYGMCVCVCVCIYIYIYVCVYICVCRRMCVCVCVYAQNMQKLTKYTNNKLCFKLVFLYTIISRCAVNRTYNLQNQLKQPQYKIHTKWNSYTTIKYPQYKVTLMYMVFLSPRTSP